MGVMVVQHRLNRARTVLEIRHRAAEAHVHAGPEGDVAHGSPQCIQEAQRGPAMCKGHWSERDAATVAAAELAVATAEAVPSVADMAAPPSWSLAVMASGSTTSKRPGMLGRNTGPSDRAMLFRACNAYLKKASASGVK
jgi:hypothetical protein